MKGLLSVYLVVGVAAIVAGCGTTNLGPVAVEEFYTIPAGQDVGLSATTNSPAVAAKVKVSVSAIEDVPESVRGLLPENVSAWLVFGAERSTPVTTNAVGVSK